MSATGSRKNSIAGGLGGVQQKRTKRDQSPAQNEMGWKQSFVHQGVRQLAGVGFGSLAFDYGTDSACVVRREGEWTVYIYQYTTEGYGGESAWMHIVNLDPSSDYNQPPFRLDPVLWRYIMGTPQSKPVTNEWLAHNHESARLKHLPPIQVARFYAVDYNAEEDSA